MVTSFVSSLGTTPLGASATPGDEVVSPRF
jgi:hypothetical protein